MKQLVILTILFIYGCSSNRVLIQPQADNDQIVAYARGASGLHSQSVLKLKLAIIDYSHDEMIISLSTTNDTLEPKYLFRKKILK